MPLLYIRAIEPYQPGANQSDVIINQVHFNRTALDRYNYTLYTNGTLSNGSDCYLAFQNFRPYMFAANGSFVNGTSCYTPIHPISRHASAGMAFALMFVISLLFSLANLSKHSRLYLAVDRRWNPIGRRWKWYWLLALGVCGTIASLMSVDVDRDHVQSAPLVIQSVFYSLLTPVMLAAVWEAVRNWGTFQERQTHLQDPLAYNAHTSREQQERILPLLFYLFTVITFFLSIARNWSSIQLQRDPQQQALRAKPFATDARFQAAGFLALVAVLIILYSLGHSIYRYIPHPHSHPHPHPLPTHRSRRHRSRSRSRSKSKSRTHQNLRYYTLQAAPPHLAVSIIILVVKIAYDVAAAFAWSISPLRFGVHPAWIYGLGYTPALLLIALFDVCGLCETNEDKALIAQRMWVHTALAEEEEEEEEEDKGDGARRGGKRLAKWRWLLRRGRNGGGGGGGGGDHDDHGDSNGCRWNCVEMDTIAGGSVRDKKPVALTTASAMPTDSQSNQTANPFSSGASSCSDDDPIGFIEDVLSSLDQARWDREA